MGDFFDLMKEKNISSVYLITMKHSPAFDFYFKNGFEDNIELRVMNRVIH